MRATLLLADDSITIQRVIELTFADEDIRVLVANDGQQAIQKIESDRPDIVLADIGMPRVDGYAVAAHVKQSSSLKHIPVLLLTGAFEPIDEARARQTGCDGVLVKPFEPQKLVARVKELLGGVRGAEMWPVDMPRAQVPLVQPVPLVQRAPGVRPMPDLLQLDQHEVASPPLSMPPVDAAIDLDPPVEPAVETAVESAADSVFDLGEEVAAAADTPAALEGEDVAHRNREHAFRQSRPDLPPPVDRLETELDMLDAALSRLDPTANPQVLDDATASDFARDLNELRNEARLEDERVTRPSRPSFGNWDLPQPASGSTKRDQPIDVVPEEIPLVLNPSPMLQKAPPVEAAPQAPQPARVEIAPVAVPVPAPVAPVPQYVAPRAPQYIAPPAPALPPAPAPAEAPAAKPLERPTLAAAFSALLAAEKSRPAALAAAPQISEAAIEEVVRRVLSRMAGETVNRVVLETAERMIRDEISRTKDPFGR